MSDVPPKQPITGTDSVRMGDSGGLPHVQNPIPDPVPVTPTSSATADFSATSALISMHDAAARGGGDAFPVLKAFQEYLESERQRARRRMVMLSCIFAAVIIIVIGGFMLMWFTTIKGMQATNAQLLAAALEKREQTPAEQPQPVVIQAPVPAGPSAAETAKIIAEAVTKAQSEQSANFAKTLEGLNASLAAMQKDNADMKAEIEKRKEAEAKTIAAVKAAAEKAAAEKIASAKAAVEKAQAGKTAQIKAPAIKTSQPSQASAGSQPATHQKTPSPLPQQDLQIPKFQAPPPPEGFKQENMGIKLPKEAAPVSWRIYLPEHSN